MTARNRRLLILLAAVAPAFLLIGVLFVVPLIRLLLLSMTDAYPTPTDAFTFANYLDVFGRAFHRDSLLTSLGLSAIVTVVAAVLGYPLAYYLVRSTSRFKGLVLLAIISPLLISIVVRSIGWLILLGREGILNQVLLALHLTPEPLQLLYTFPTVVVGEVNILMPFMVLSLTTSLSQIPRSLEEGASVLGAGAVRRFFGVTLPLSAPGLISGSMLVFILTMGSYVTPQMLGGGKVNVITIDIYSRMMVDFDWPMGAALAVVTLVLTLGVIVGMSRVQSKLLGGVGQ